MKLDGSRMLRLLALGTSAVLLACCGKCGLEELPPVTDKAICGSYASREGAVVVFDRGGTAHVEDVAIGTENDRGQLAGSGSWRIEKDFPTGWHVAITAGDPRYHFDLTVERSWRGELSLWRYLGDPDSMLRETFLRSSGCGEKW